MREEDINKKIIIDKREIIRLAMNNKITYKEEIIEGDMNNKTEEEMIIKDSISQEENQVIKKDINNYFLYSYFFAKTIYLLNRRTQFHNSLSITHEFSNWISS